MKTRACRLIAILLVMAGLFHSAFAQAASCALATVIGTYGFAVQGSFLSGKPGYGNSVAGATGLIALAGTYRFGRDGTVTRTFAINVNGQFSDNVVDSGTFAINPDCTGTAVINAPFGLEPIKLSIVGGGDAIMFMNGLDGVYLTGRMERQ